MCKSTDGFKNKSEREVIKLLVNEMADLDCKYDDTFPNEMKRVFIKKYVSQIDLEDVQNTVQIQTHNLPIDKWEFFSKEELLNSYKTKFVSNKQTENRFIVLTFQKPLPLCAIGLRSANHYPHLDP